MVLRVIQFIFCCFLLTSCSSGEVKEEKDLNVVLDGKQLYLQNCGACHGIDGDLGISGAKPLSQSLMEKDSILIMMNEGRGAMPPFIDMLSDKEKDVIAEHALTLKK